MMGRQDERIHESFDWDWLFHRGDIKEGERIQLDHGHWQSVNLPHDYTIEGDYKEDHIAGFKGGYLPTGIGWYRKKFTIRKAWLSKRVFITFDGIYMNSDVWVNGQHLGHRPYGYIGFQYDVTPYIHEGDNIIAVRVDHEKGPTGRWYTGSGIYRHAWLTVKEPLHLAHWGTSVTTPNVTQKKAHVHIETKVKNHQPLDKEVRVHGSILDRYGKEVGSKELQAETPREGETLVHYTMDVEQPFLWSPDNPHMYRLVTSIYEGHQLVDREEVSFGIRYVSFSVEEGFTLNDKPLLLQGVCQHHDGGPVGVAVPEKVLARRLNLLKEMGCNAIRTGHTPFAPEFYHMCDRLGIMVMDEIFDGWETPKMPYDYGLYFEKWWQRDLGDFIRRDRNHPSIILWSIGNEVMHQTMETTGMLVDYVHTLDPTRPVTCGVQRSHQLADDNRSLLDIAGYNGGGEGAFIFQRDHERHPDRVCVATEVPHTFQTRGFYRTQTWWRDKHKPRIEIDNLTEEEIFHDGNLVYNSSYDNAGVRISARDSWRQTKSLPYLIGEFRWTGFDYLGESFGWPARSANFGVLDLAGFKKDHYFFYQSQWTKEPMINVLPHWTHRNMEGVIIPVWVYTNCDRAELLLNGVSLGEKAMGDEMVITWDVPYEPGILEVYGKIGEEVVTRKVMSTAGCPEAIGLEIDNQELLADGRDISHVAFHMIDSQGIKVPHGSNKVYLITEGPVVCLGTENGDPLDLTPAKSSVRRAFYGSGLGIYQSMREDGDIHIMAIGILGERYFHGDNQITIAVTQSMLRGSHYRKELNIYYTLDGQEPTRDSTTYISPICIHDTSTIKVAVYHGDRHLLIMEDTFIKGEPEPVVDTTHGNREDGHTSGPFGKEVLGRWTTRGVTLTLMEKGKGWLQTGEGIIQGNWWYDFPADPFEEPEDAGAGELHYKNQKAIIKLRDQQAKSLYMSYEGREYTLMRG